MSQTVQTPAVAPLHGNYSLLRRGAVAAIVVVVLTAFLALVYLRQVAAARIAVTTQNLSSSMELTFDGLIGTIDIALLASANVLSSQLSSGRVNEKFINQFLAQEKAALAHIDLLRATDARGDVVFGVDATTITSNLADRDYFIYLRDHPKAGLFMGQPVQGRVDHVWGVPFARRITKQDGTFAGVVIGRIKIDEIDRIMAKIPMDAGDSISLRDANMGLITRYIFNGHNTIAIGNQRISIPFADALKVNPEEGTFISDGTSIDLVRRTYSYNRNEKYGFNVIVGIVGNSVLADWRKQVWIVMALVLIFVLASLGFLLLLGRAWRRQAQDMQALALSQQSLEEAQRIANIGQYSYDLKTGRWTSSAIFDGIVGIDDHYPRDVAHWMALIVSDASDKVRQYVESLIAQRASFECDFRIVRPSDGQSRWLHCKGKPQNDAHGEPVSLIGTIEDITERRLSELALQASEARYARVLDGADEGFWEWDLKRKTLSVSPRFESMLGYATGEWGDRVDLWASRVHPDDYPNARFSILQSVRGISAFHEMELRCRTKSGDWRWVLVRGQVVTRDANGRALIMSGTQTDISYRKKAEEIIWQQANYDLLTQLPNRRMLRDRLAQEVRKARHDESRLALLFIDLDRFKEVNDTLGHDKGDILLVEAARRISACVRESDTVSRQGGDEFTVILPQASNLERVEQVAQCILGTLSEGFDLDGEKAFVSASIGIALYPDDATDVEGLHKSADQAMYAAKDTGRNRFSFFTQAMQETAQNRMRLLNDMRCALTEGQFRLVYQPIVALDGSGAHKAEALIRWQHPTLGLISPAEFIPLAESSGLIVEIGEWVFRQAADQVKLWRGVHHPHFQISVNKSPVQFANGGQLQKTWFDYLRAQGLPGQSIVVEITESLLLSPQDDIMGQLFDLREAGIGVSLDDFGTGYSSLSYLQKFDIDFVKIDQSFVRHLTPVSKNMSLCKAIIVMAHELGMKVIAEGVETSAQRDLLADAGCDYAQGYLFSRPLPPAEFDAWMQTYPAVAALAISP